jgi:hypothetical protein
LNAGKHVVCEKPLAVNAVEAQEIVDLARWLGPTGTKDGWVDEDSNQEDLCVCILIYIYCIYICVYIYNYLYESLRIQHIWRWGPKLSGCGGLWWFFKGFGG